MASVASELGAIHHAHQGLGLRGNSQAASQEDSADSFGSLLDGTDNSPPAHAARAAPASSSAPPPQQSATDQSAEQPRQTPGGDAAQTPPPPTSLPANAGVADGSDDRRGGGAVKADVAPSAPIVGKADKPFIPVILDAAARINGLRAVGPIVPADPGGDSDAASNAAGQAAPGAATGLPDRHDDKTKKSDTSDSTQATTAPGADSTLNPRVAPLPQPVAVAVSAPAVTPAGDDDGAEIAQLAAAGEGARSGRSEAAGADATAADAAPSGKNASTGEEDSAQPPTQPPSGTAPNSPIRPERAVGPQPKAFANPAVVPDAGRNLHPNGAFRASGEDPTAVPDHDRPASQIVDPSQQAGETQDLDTGPIAVRDSKPVDHDPPATASPPPDAADSPATSSNLAAPAGAAPTVSTAPTTQAAAPASTAVPPAVPIAGLAVEIAARAHAGRNRFDIRLDPPDLGRIDVRLDVDHDGKVTSHLVVERQETLDVLRRDAPQIERSLQQAGLKTADNGLQFTLRDQSFGQQNPYPRHETLAGGLRIVVPDADLPTADAVKGRYGGIAGLGTGIDISV